MVIILNKQLLCPLRLFARSFSLLTHDLLVALSMYESDFFIYFCGYLLNNPKEMIMHLSSTLLKHMEQL